MNVKNYEAIKANNGEKRKRFVCSECGGANLQVRAWVDINTNEYVSDCDDDEVWCEDCEDFVTVKEVED